MPSLFDPVQMGDLSLPNRIVIVPLNPDRAVAGLKPSRPTVEYYRQRTSVGLSIAEASRISPMGRDYLDTPGIHSAEQPRRSGRKDHRGIAG